jgi:hypothetical protein
MEMVPLSGHGPSFFSGFWNLIFFLIPPDFKKMEGKDPLDPLIQSKRVLGFTKYTHRLSDHNKVTQKDFFRRNSS